MGYALKRIANALRGTENHQIREDVEVFNITMLRGLRKRKRASPSSADNRVGPRPGPPGRRQYDTFFENKLFARDVLVDLHLNLALFAFPPCKNIDFLILFVKTSHPRRLPNRSIPRKTLPEFEFWLIECIHKLLASSSPLKKTAGT